MATRVVDSVEDLYNGEINVNQPLDWEFLGASVPSWSRWDSYRAGDCAQLPGGQVWCARRSIKSGDVGPGETGWTSAWGRSSPAMIGALLGADSAAEAASAQRHRSGRGGSMLGADSAAEAANAQRHRGGGNMLGADSAAEAANAQRHRSGRGGGGEEMLGALYADFHALKELARDRAAAEQEAGIGADPVMATQKIIERARDEKPPSAPPDSVVEYDDSDELSINPVREEILGAELDTVNFPLTSSLYKHFQAKAPPSKYVRLDTEDSYREFRADVAELQRKVARLESLVSSHISDDHGAQDAIVGLASDISNLQSSTAGKRVPLQMPPWADGTWACWREDGPNGGLVCCSISLPGHDGNVRICTAATPVKGHVESVVGYTRDVGCGVAELLGVLPTLACMLAGSHLMSEMAAAAPTVLAHPSVVGSNRPFIGRIVPANHPTLAALIALLQGAQAGNQQAAREWTALSQAAVSNSDLALSMSEARGRLVAAQG